MKLWKNSPDKYKAVYFYGRERFSNKEMAYGKRLADYLEGRVEEEDEMIVGLATLLPKYRYMGQMLEQNLETKHGIIRIVGAPDTYDARPLRFREYKTGKRPWSQALVDKSEQITMYCLLLYLKYGKIPKDIWLDWAETTDGRGDGGIALTGNIQSFKTSRRLADILRLAREIERVALEIQKTWREEMKKLS
ncbi:MAG: hypothetical protein WDZ61_00475 [Parcubacteria group bacterium]